MRTPGPVAFLFFMVLWSSMTLLFDSFMVFPVVRQLFATSYLSVPGKILSSEVVQKDTDDGTVIRVKVRFAYSVNGVDYVGGRFRYGAHDFVNTRAMVAALPAGKTVLVYYRKSSPGDSIVAPKLYGGDLFHFIFMMPFNIVMLGFGWIACGRLRRAWLHPLAGGVKIIHEPGKKRARLTALSPIATAFVTVGLLAFCSLFVVLLVDGGPAASLRTMIVTLSIIFGGGILAGIWQAAMASAGKYDLIIDELNGVMELPRSCGGKAPVRIPFARVERITVETEQSESDENNSPLYAPTIWLAQPKPSSHRLVKWYDEDKAHQFVEWLRMELPKKGLPVRTLAGIS